MPHDEVFSSDAENLVDDRRWPETMAYVPSPTQAEQRRLLRPDAHAKQSDGVDDDTARQDATGTASQSWSVPDVLLQQMKDLSTEPIAGRWAEQTCTPDRGIGTGGRRGLGQSHRS